MRMIPTCSIVFPCRQIRQPTPVRGIRGPIVAGLTDPSSTTRTAKRTAVSPRILRLLEARWETIYETEPSLPCSPELMSPF